MKIKTEVKGFESFGEIESKNFSVDTEDTMIIRLLRDKMYSNKIAAVSREIASNSRDANRENGIPFTPITIKLEKTEETILSDSEFTISFKDNGIGISPERMENIFLKYGSSTKRDSNNYTGGFGIGAKTPFAYTDTFFINTVVEENGTKNKYYYQASITSDGTREVSKMITLDVEETDEKTGTEIIVPILEKDVEDFKKEIIFCTRFWSVMPNFVGFGKQTELEIVYHTDEFMIVSDKIFGTHSKYIALIDEIPYVLDNDTLINLNSKIVEDEKKFKIQREFLKYVYIFKTGEISVSGSREEVEYIDSNIEMFKKTNSIIQEKGIKLIDNFVNSASTYKEFCCKVSSLISSSSFIVYDLKGFNLENINESEKYILFLGAINRLSSTTRYTDSLSLMFENKKAISSFIPKTFSLNIYSLNSSNQMRNIGDLRHENIGGFKWDLPIYYMDLPRIEPSRNAQLKNLHPNGYILITNFKEDIIYLPNGETIKTQREKEFKFLEDLDIKINKYSEVEKLKTITTKNGTQRKASEIISVSAKIYPFSSSRPVAWTSIELKYDKKNKEFINLLQTLKNIREFVNITDIAFIEREALADFNNKNISYGNVPALSSIENGIRKILFTSNVVVIGISSSKSQYFKDAKIKTMSESLNDLLNGKSRIKNLLMKSLNYSLCENLFLETEIFSQINTSTKIKNSIQNLKNSYANLNLENEQVESFVRCFYGFSLETIKEMGISISEELITNLEDVNNFINDNPLLKMFVQFQSGQTRYFNAKEEVANPIYQQFIDLFNNQK